MLNVLGLVLNFIGAVLLSINIVLATKVEAILSSGGTRLGPKTIGRALATRSNARLGFIYAATGFGLQLFHEVKNIETNWAVLGLLTLDAVLIVAVCYDDGKSGQRA